MNIEQKGIFILIKSALTGEKLSLPENFDFAKACEIAKAHGASAIIYYGALNCGFDENSAEMQSLFLMTATYISVNERQLFMVKKIFDAFEKNNIDYLPLKGIALQRFYPKAGMRIMGDADILIRMEQYPKIRDIMFSLGFKEGEVSNHEIKWFHESLFVELHSKLIPSYNKDYYVYFGDGWQLAKENDGNRFKMTDEDELIYLFTHFAKHYRDAGIGIKHILDIWVYLENHKNLNTDYIENELKKLSLYEFYLNILDTFDVWFNGQAENEKTELITQVIFRSGAAGSYETAVLSSALKSAKSQNKQKMPRLKKVYKTIFLPFDKMCGKYSILKKCPILLPAFWVANIFGVFKRKSVTNVFEDFKIISQQNVNNYQESLNFVGLDFNFKE